ncbi:chemotaxis protein CheA [Lacimicrobium sp. SS2-24]|uniref:chemotaxis protein CheA n=1 Tax=Lacimicrobium sp. SS2-24 TaxID=2005569 RepID=UPI000B4A6CB7|nr:chemotaxis protein CheA [Lacimicrobium sp. SS2-24]
MTVEMEQFHQVFFDESQEHLETMERLLMEIQPESPDTEHLNSIFRAAHSIKGGSGIFGFDGLGGLTHVMENLLDKARNGTQELTPTIVNQLLQTVDVLKTVLEDYRNAQPINQAEIDQAILLLQETIDNDCPESDSGNEERGFGFFESTTSEAEDAFGFFESEPQSENQDDSGFGFFDNEPSSPNASVSSLPKTSGCDRKPAPAPARPVSSSNGKNASESKSIRIDTSKIDMLVNLIGELVITQSMLAVVGQQTEDRDQEKLEQGLLELERNTRELQEAVMSMRMLPISFVFNRFPRLVRDLAGQLGKQVELKIEGGGTEIDKGLVEKLVDPLTHLVRNSIDHGIEMPEPRVAQGKSEVGQITLAAAQRGGNIVISIKDDGAGLNKERILAKATENGIAVPDRDNDEDIWQLIFSPGFSTADQVTDISGRGVGMDVVKRNIESIGGRISIESSAGKGSAFAISVPLTLAIVDGMCVASADQVFVVPLVSIIESIQPASHQLRQIANEHLLWVRDQYWPILNLSKRMDIDGAIGEPTDAIIILIETSKKRFGLMVDRLLGQQQVVIKSLEQHYKRVPGAAGATIMGDGKVAIILDMESLAEDVNTQVAEAQTYERDTRERKAS